MRKTMWLYGQWRGQIQAIVLILGLFLVGVYANPPAWWGGMGVTTQDDPADYGAANQGQVKWMATKAQEDFDAMLVDLGGAGASISNLTGAFSATNNYLAANLGQVKAVAALFYDRLWDLSTTEPYLTNAFPSGMSGDYPWSTNTTDDADYAMANIGQVKYVFSFDLDRDADGAADWWEMDNGLDPGDEDMDDDGLMDGAEIGAGTSPTNYWDPGPLTLAISFPSEGQVLP